MSLLYSQIVTITCHRLMSSRLSVEARRRWEDLGKSLRIYRRISSTFCYGFDLYLSLDTTCDWSRPILIASEVGPKSHASVARVTVRKVVMDLAQCKCKSSVLTPSNNHYLISTLFQSFKNDINWILQLQSDINVILCFLQIFFDISFFSIMWTQFLNCDTKLFLFF